MQHHLEGDTLTKRKALQNLSITEKRMAAKPEAARVLGLAAISAGAGAGGPALAPVSHPPDDVRAIFSTQGMKIIQSDVIINAHKKFFA